MDEAELARDEAVHDCDPALLEYYGRRCRHPEHREERKSARSQQGKPVQDLAQVLDRYWSQIQKLSKHAVYGQSSNSGSSCSSPKDRVAL